jgi:hypothetical protein
MLTVAAALGRLGIPAILAAPNGLITDEATAKDWRAEAGPRR